MQLTISNILSILFFINKFRSKELIYNNQIIYNTILTANYIGQYYHNNEIIKLIKLIINIWKEQNHENFKKLIESKFQYCNIILFTYKKNNKDITKVDILLF